MSNDSVNRLSGIFGEAARLVQAPSGRITTMPVSRLRPGAGQPRRVFDETDLEALAQSIRTKGIQHPLLVRPVEGGYEIVAGERRWRAAQLAGLLEVPVIEREMTDQEAAEAALIENLQRKDLNAFEQIDGKLRLLALAWQTTPEAARGRLNELLRHPDEEEAQMLDTLFSSLGRETWQSYTKNKLRVYNWPPALLSALERGMLMGTATLLSRADEQHHPYLIGLWDNGASRAKLASEVERLASSGRRQVLEERLASKLRDRKWRESLPPKDAEELQLWLGQMPARLRRELEK